MTASLPPLPADELRPFLNGIQVDPEDDLAIRALGDWLEEMGDPRADLVRSGLYGDLNAVARWREQYGKSWWGKLPAGVQLEVRRGLIELVWKTELLAASANPLPTGLQEMIRQGWVFRVVLDGEVKWFADWTSDLFEHVTAIRWEQKTHSGVPRLPPLPRLRELDLSKSTGLIEVALPQPDRFPGLWRLYLSGCALLTQVNLSGFPELRQLRLGWNPHLTAATLNELPSLQTLSFVMNDRFRTMRTTGLPSLRELSLRGCVSLQDEDLAALAGLSALESLDCDTCTKLTGSGLYHLTGLSRLRELVLSSCERLTRLRLSDMPALAFLDLGQSGIEELELADLPLLEKLDLYCTREVRTARLVDLPKLTRVPIGNWPIATRIHVENLPALRSLNLDGLRQLRELHLSGVDGLKHLHLRDCTALGLARITELRSRLVNCQVSL
jgi:hypothetical protein